jgi:hypothetical protein
MSECEPLRCRKCGKPIGYVSIAAKSYLEPRPRTENVLLVGTCLNCQETQSFYRRNL